MNLIVYTGRLRAVEVEMQTFKRGEPVPVPRELARRLEAKPNFERFTPPKPKRVRVNKPAPAEAPAEAPTDTPDPEREALD